MSHFQRRGKIFDEQRMTMYIQLLTSALPPHSPHLMATVRLETTVVN